MAKYSQALDTADGSMLVDVEELADGSDDGAEEPDGDVLQHRQLASAEHSLSRLVRGTPAEGEGKPLLPFGLQDGFQTRVLGLYEVGQEAHEAVDDKGLVELAEGLQVGGVVGPEQTAPTGQAEDGHHPEDPDDGLLQVRPRQVHDVLQDAPEGHGQGEQHADPRDKPGLGVDAPVVALQLPDDHGDGQDQGQEVEGQDEWPKPRFQ
ncbi:uncharacterized protein LOC126025919 [Suncus etruscus]|uniref:uncharacterized protein LOC126025919 n=1 Tax=Suncus etruscus TaxID=109475 RepID=UPI002110CB78|nr:uncharacterized protein LOC126025919 [Suncus etruscus]